MLDFEGALSPRRESRIVPESKVALIYQRPTEGGLIYEVEGRRVKQVFPGQGRDPFWAYMDAPEVGEGEPGRTYSRSNTILNWQTKIHSWAVGKGFWDDAPTVSPDGLFDEATFVLSKLMLAVSELGEAAEAVRNGDRENLGEELADTVIRILDTADALDFDIAAIMVAKMEKNEARPHKHGKRA
jgi:NTP pyrophosphatase (non-canonical NTP hydrolase)